jgi:CheY-like chemotaxis protein
VEQKYKRIEDLDQKIKSISLPYQEWKTLFLVTEDTSVAEIIEVLKVDADAVQKSIDSLEGKGLIEKFSGEAQEAAVEEEKPVVPDIEEIDLKEEEIEEPPFEDETKIQVSEVEEEPAEIEEPVMEESLDLEEKAELEEEKPEDEETSMPELTEEEDFTAGLQIDEKQEAETIAEEAPTISEDEIVPEIDDIAAEKEEPAAPDTETKVDSSKKSIIVIDDSIVIRKMIEIALEDEDFNILNATSGKDGMEVIEKEKPNLVILDMMLPDMSGIDVLKKIKDSNDVPVIMLSGKDSPQLVENAKEIGVNDFLPKPFKDEELVEKVKALV